MRLYFASEEYFDSKFQQNHFVNFDHEYNIKDIKIFLNVS